MRSRREDGQFPDKPNYGEWSNLGSNFGSVPIVIELVRTLDVDADVLRLLLRELGEFHTERVEVQAGHLFVEVLRQPVDVGGVLAGLGEQLDLRDRLVGEGV